MSEAVYIAEMSSIIPTLYEAEFLADRLFPIALYGAAINRMARKFAARIGVRERASVIDYDLYPDIEFSSPQDHPRQWGRTMVENLTQHIGKEEIGHFGVSYNISPHRNTLPNLASQIVMETHLTGVERSDEIGHYGCAAGLFSLEKAVRYCAEQQRAAIVFTFDQCTTHFQRLDPTDPDFRAMMVTNLLFNDAGVGLLLIPERLREAYPQPLPRVDAIKTCYRSGNSIGMRNGRFLMGDGVKEVMPELVSELLLKPFLAEHELENDDIDEWSIHQGGSEVLKQFCQRHTADLSEQQIDQSLQLFHRHGNTSAPSCLLILESFFKEGRLRATDGDKGLVVGFGAGYYLGGLLYSWCH